MSHCRYCLGPITAKRRRTSCCPEHAKALQRQRSRERGQTRAALARAIRSARERNGHAWRWRQIALGLDAAEHIAVVFRPKRKRRPFE